MSNLNTKHYNLLENDKNPKFEKVKVCLLSSVQQCMYATALITTLMLTEVPLDLHYVLTKVYGDALVYIENIANDT